MAVNTGNLFTDEEVTGGKRNVLLDKDTEQYGRNNIGKEDVSRKILMQ